MKHANFIDPRDPSKLWIVKRTKDRHYYVNRMVDGIIQSLRFKRCKVSSILLVLGLTHEELLKWMT